MTAMQNVEVSYLEIEVGNSRKYLEKSVKIVVGSAPLIFKPDQWYSSL